MTDKEILDLIKKHRGITFSHGYNIEGGNFWSAIGGDVNSGGYETLEEALQKWAEVQSMYDRGELNVR